MFFFCNLCRQATFYHDFNIFFYTENLASKHRLIECVKQYFAKSASFLLVYARK